MLYEYMSTLFGIIKILVYKMIYASRIKFKSIPKMNNSFKISIKKGSKLILGKNYRSRYNVSFRIYDKGVVKIGECELDVDKIYENIDERKIEIKMKFGGTFIDVTAIHIKTGKSVKTELTFD